MIRRTGQFRSRTDAMNRRKLVWYCANCRQRYEVKVKACDYCGARDFHYFASKLEAKRFAELCLQMDLGQITELEVQVPFPVIINGKAVTTYKADFRYRDRNGKEILEDVKPQLFRDELYKLKKKLIEAIYPITITEVTP